MIFRSRRSPSPPMASRPRASSMILPAAGAHQAHRGIAPKGFFDDLPQPALTKPTQLTPSTVKPSPARPTVSPGVAQAAKGFFDDLPQPSGLVDAPIKSAVPLIELDDPPEAALELDGDGPALELDGQAPALELRDAPSSGQFDELDLSKPTASPVRFDAPQRRRSPTGGPSPGSLPPINASVNRANGDGSPSSSRTRSQSRPSSRRSKRRSRPQRSRPRHHARSAFA